VLTLCLCLCLCVSRCVAVCRRGVLAGVFGDGPLRLELELLLIRGVEHFDLRLFWRRIYVPLLLPLCDVVLVPFCLARLAGGALDALPTEHWLLRLAWRWLAVPTPAASPAAARYLLRTALSRFAMHLALLLRALWTAAAQTVGLAVRLHGEVRDRRFLVSTELANRSAA
jgi:hypothetical protein